MVYYAKCVLNTWLHCISWIQGKNVFLDCAAIVNKLYHYIYNLEKQNSITNYIYLINLE